MSKKTGGPAFPFAVKGGNEPVKGHEVFGDIPKDLTTYYAGLSVRDYFAAKAMAAIVRRYDGHRFGGHAEAPEYIELASDAYLIADAMLRARGQ